jgi:hypothetical protein
MNKTIIKILQKVFIIHFYKLNAGFFLFGFVVLYGIVAPGMLISYHLSLMQGMIQSYSFLGFVIFFWLLYTMKCIDYTVKQLNDPKQIFLFALHTLSNQQQFFYLLYVHTLIYLPVGLYASIVAMIAAKQGFYGSMFAVITSNILMMAGATYLYRIRLQRRAFIFFTLMPEIHFRFKKQLCMLPLWFLMNHRKQMLLITKIFSLLLLYAFTNLYEPEQYDVRPILLIMLMIAMAHCTIVLQIRQFEESFLSFNRNLPVSILKRFVGMLWMFIILLLPEFLFVWKAFPIHFMVTDYPQIVLVPVSGMAFFYSILLMDDIDAESYYRIVFGMAAILFFIILYNPGILLFAFLTGISFILYGSHLFSFERRYVQP